jgi:hypothetical protein
MVKLGFSTTSAPVCRFLATTLETRLALLTDIGKFCTQTACPLTVTEKGSFSTTLLLLKANA